METITIKSLDELAGRTIKKVITSGYGSNISMLFEDGAVVTFVVERGYEVGDEEVGLSEKGVDVDTLFHLGVITEAELAAIRAREQREHEEEARQNRLAQYEQLKREFEGVPAPPSPVNRRAE